MANSQTRERLPKPPAGEYEFVIKHAGIKDGAVWFVLGNDQYDLLQYADLRKGALFSNDHCVLAAIIAETGPCGVPRDLVGRAVKVRVVLERNETGEKEYTKIYDVRGVDNE